MAKKGENIHKRQDGRWEARYVKGYALSGTIQYGYCYGRTYQEAKQKVVGCKADIARGLPPLQPTNDGHRFAFYCIEWLQRQRGAVKESTYVKYETILKNHILPGLGTCFPWGITTWVVEQFKQKLLQENLCAKTVRDILVVLQSILQYTDRQFACVFPVVDIAYPKEEKKEARVLSVEEQKLFVSYLRTDMDTCKFGILLALLTGLRIGELCALRWRNVSLRKKEIYVEATLQRLRAADGAGAYKTKLVLSTPKSGTSIRTIPLTETAAGLCGQFDPHCPAAFVLTGTEQFMEPRRIQRRLAKFTADCDLEGVHFHTIRHTFATRCVEVGFEIKCLSAILGHANTNITLNRYVHASRDLKRENMNKLRSVGL